MGSLALILIAGLASATPANAAPAEVTSRSSAAGTYWFDTKGFSLYTYDADTPGRSACIQTCAETWPPVEAAAGAAETGDWKVLLRDDGRRQWTLQGRPLYRFVLDTYPGSRMGEIGTNGWRIAFEPVETPSGIRLKRVLEGWILASADGRTLYSSQGAGAAAQAPSAWVPFPAPALANSFANWAVIARPDGIRQWTYRGRPLFTHRKETEARSAIPIGAFAPELIERLPAIPGWATIQISDTGAVIADERGMSVYMVRNMDQVIEEQTCLDACMKTNWRTVPAKAGAQPVGNWSIVPDDDGTSIWAYMGRKVFTHTRDKKPGDTLGYGVGVGQGIGGGWRPIPVANLLPAQ